MRSQKDSRSDRNGKRIFPVHPKTFVFFDRTTRIQRFEVKAQSDGTMPTHEAASLLAMHCLLRGLRPRDFGVMVAVGEDLSSSLGPIARRMMAACVAVQHAVQLTRRQQEVLRGVMQSRSNKEIAQQLNIAVRTVKFHISRLLARFGAVDRMSLAQKTGEMLSTGKLPSKAASFPPLIQ